MMRVIESDDLLGTYNDGNTIVRKWGDAYRVTILYTRKDGYTGHVGRVSKDTRMTGEQVRRLIRKYST